jgi:hypothetical protein
MRLTIEDFEGNEQFLGQQRRNAIKDQFATIGIAVDRHTERLFGYIRVDIHERPINLPGRMYQCGFVARISVHRQLRGSIQNDDVNHPMIS